MPPDFQLLLDPPPDTLLEEAQRETAESLRPTHGWDDKQFLAAFRRAVRLEPNDPDYYFMLGDALARLGRDQEAVPALREAILMSPADATYRHALGVALWRLGRNEEAAQALGEASRQRPDDAASWVALGAALAALGRNREAVRALHQAIRHEGRHASAYSNLGAALWGLSRRADALQAFRRACQLEPRRAELHRNLARALAAGGRDAEARAALRTAIQLRRDDPALHLDLAELLFAGGSRAEARTALQQALVLDPGCLRDRPASQEAQAALRLEELRAELSPETGAGSLGWRAVHSVFDGLGRSWRRIAPRQGALGTAFWLVTLAAVARLAFCLLPPYFDYYLLKDRLAEVAGAPLDEDSLVQERLDHAVREQGLESVVRADQCQIETRPRWRTIRCEYEQPVEIVPGLRHRLRFELSVEKPFLAPEKTIFQ
jgi:Flp pilus assembly protein TadD